MAKRLQVILQDPEYREIRRAARSRRMTLAAWVREALANARRAEPSGDVEKKLAAVRAAVKYEFPAPDVQTMLAEIERGYLAGSNLDPD